MNVLGFRTISIAISGMVWLKCTLLFCPVFGERRSTEAARRCRIKAQRVIRDARRRVPG